jgi:hypothetical protein
LYQEALGEDEDDYILFDCPGQVQELTFYHACALKDENDYVLFVCHSSFYHACAFNDEYD